ncbi:MAG: carboxypeptidase-like regulatory domain-containing protein [Flavobacteriales bacterium]
MRSAARLGCAMLGLCAGVAPAAAQTPRCPTPFVLSGFVTDPAGHLLPSAMVVNLGADGIGTFVERDGSFLLRVCAGDTVAVGALGYRTVRRPATQEAADWTVRLERLQVALPEAEVVAPRELHEIVEEIRTLGYREEDFRITGIDAFRSPITFLYEQYNRTARSAREVRALENDDRRRALLRELFGKYVSYDIIALDEAQFDAFIRFCDPGDELLKTWTQYEFILYVKDSYARFSARNRGLQPSDYLYSW